VSVERWRTVKYVLPFLILAAALLGLLSPARDWMGKNAVVGSIIVILVLAASVQHLLRGDPDVSIIARGPMPFLTGDKATVGLISHPDR
jgi:hypothetical protein